MLEREDLQTLSSAAAGNSVLRAATRTHESSNQKKTGGSISGGKKVRERGRNGKKADIALFL
jgi:hypothetical protein